MFKNCRMIKLQVGTKPVHICMLFYQCVLVEFYLLSDSRKSHFLAMNDRTVCLDFINFEFILQNNKLLNVE